MTSRDWFVQRNKALPSKDTDPHLHALSGFQLLEQRNLNLDEKKEEES